MLLHHDAFTNILMNGFKLRYTTHQCLWEVFIDFCIDFKKKLFSLEYFSSQLFHLNTFLHNCYVNMNKIGKFIDRSCSRLMNDTYSTQFCKICLLITISINDLRIYSALFSRQKVSSCISSVWSKCRLKMCMIQIFCQCSKYISELLWTFQHDT